MRENKDDTRHFLSFLTFRLSYNRGVGIPSISPKSTNIDERRAEKTISNIEIGEKASVN